MVVFFLMHDDSKDSILEIYLRLAWDTDSMLCPNLPIIKIQESRVELEVTPLAIVKIATGKILASYKHEENYYGF